VEPSGGRKVGDMVRLLRYEGIVERRYELAVKV
jgi:hypothetical protein